MAISKELLEILVCPLCKAALDLKHSRFGPQKASAFLRY